MYELVQVAENSFYLQSPAKIGIVRLNEKDVCLIDSGNDKDAGRKIRQILDANGWHLTAIYNTHVVLRWPRAGCAAVSAIQIARSVTSVSSALPLRSA